MQDEQVQEIRRYVAESYEASLRVKNSSTGSELRKAWEDYMSSFSRAIGRMINLGLSKRRTKPWAYKLKNLSNGQDPGLTFLREARNVVEHGLLPFAKFNDPHAVVEGRVKVGGTSNVRFIGCTFGNKYVHSLELETIDGKVVNRRGDPHARTEERPASVILTAIENSEKGKVVEVPERIMAHHLRPGNPMDLCTASFEVLEAFLKEFEGLWLDNGKL